jgi:L-amino acid N-acyltransferase YncA
VPAVIIVRDAREDDAQAIVDILNPIILERAHSAFDTPFTVGQEREYLQRFPARGIWKVATHAGDGRVIGFQIVEPFATYTNAFNHVGTMGTFVDLAFRNQGIAAHLFEATFETARAKGYEKFFTFVRADNPMALRAYTRHGFTVVGTARKQARIDGRYIDEILIEKLLS